jgi:hypothetical protein
MIRKWQWIGVALKNTEAVVAAPLFNKFYQYQTSKDERVKETFGRDSQTQPLLRIVR